MREGTSEIIIFLVIIGLINSGCSLLSKDPVTSPSIFTADFSGLDPNDFPEKIRQLEDIAQNHENISVRTRAHLYIALAHIHYNNPSPDYSLALKYLNEYIALDQDNERIDEAVIWMSILRDLDSSIREFDDLKKNFDLLKQENVRANKDWKYLNKEKKELSKTIENQKKKIASLEEKIKKLDSLYLEIEKKKKTIKKK